MSLWFIATERFGPWSGDTWTNYVKWSGLNQLDELVSLDGSLNPPILKEMKNEYWQYVPNENHIFGIFTDLNFLLNEVSGNDDLNLLCVYMNPKRQPDPLNSPKRFEFIGYDLVEVDGTTSALSNCGGFPDVFSNHELSSKGLLQSFERAIKVQKNLREMHSEEHHANCDVWAISRAVGHFRK